MTGLLIKRNGDALDEYVQEFLKLAAEEDIELNEKKLRRVLSHYSFSDIERVYDACCRFGIKNLWESI